jgi:hypothetical protein
MGDISLRGRGVVRKKFGKGGLSRRGFLGIVAGAAAAPDLMKALKGEKKAVKAAKVTENISNKGSGLTRSELIKKVNNKTATLQEREELDMMHEMDTLP